MISPASVDDAPGAAALFAASFDDRIDSVASVRYSLERLRPEDRAMVWRAERDGEIVGWARAGREAFAADDTEAYASIVVHPTRRRAGIGTALWDVVSEHLHEIGARRIVVRSRADDDSIAFARARGFSRTATERSSGVDPRMISPPPKPPPGLELRPVSDFAENPEPIYAADYESALDEPGPSDNSGMTYDSWRRYIWDAPDRDYELSAVAVANGVVVGTTFLQSDHASGRAASGGTGVIPAFRGKGIGLLMKRYSLSRAAAAGITWAITQNDETNAPMLAINARLGYRPFSVAYAWVLER